MANNRKRTIMIMAGGTGGHIFPGLAVADILSAKGWQVIWMGAPAMIMMVRFAFFAISGSALAGCACFSKSYDATHTGTPRTRCNFGYGRPDGA